MQSELIPIGDILAKAPQRKPPRVQTISAPPADIASQGAPTLPGIPDAHVTAAHVAHESAGIDSTIGAIHALYAKRAVADAIAERAGELRPIVTQHFGDAKSFTLPERSHKALAECIALAMANVPIMLVGPAGSGKTHLARQIAKTLERPFTFNSLSAGTTESHVLGRILPDESGNWTYRPAPFIHTYRSGGVHLFDEIDAADPNMLLILNAAIANGHVAVPFAQVEPFERHPDFLLIAAANTFGRGADRQYVGRSALDASTLDRFSVQTVFVDYDCVLELDIAESLLKTASKTDALLQWANRIRAGIERNRLRRIMSTRTIENAARCLAVGIPMDVVESRYFAGWTADERAKVDA